MACKCKNEDGNPADNCYGTCNLERVVHYANNTLDERIIDILENFCKKIKRQYDDQYLDGYKDGFKEGFEAGKGY